MSRKKSGAGTREPPLQSDSDEVTIHPRHIRDESPRSNSPYFTDEEIVAQGGITLNSPKDPVQNPVKIQSYPSPGSAHPFSRSGSYGRQAVPGSSKFCNDASPSNRGQRKITISGEGGGPVTNGAQTRDQYACFDFDGRATRRESNLNTLAGIMRPSDVNLYPTVNVVEPGIDLREKGNAHRADPVKIDARRQTIAKTGNVCVTDASYERLRHSIDDVQKQINALSSAIAQNEAKCSLVSARRKPASAETMVENPNVI